MQENQSSAEKGAGEVATGAKHAKVRDDCTKAEEQINGRRRRPVANTLLISGKRSKV